MRRAWDSGRSTPDLLTLSKYVDSLDDSQVEQITESVKRAIATHPKMVRYFICLPFDLLTLSESPLISSLVHYEFQRSRLVKVWLSPLTAPAFRHAKRLSSFWWIHKLHEQL